MTNSVLTGVGIAFFAGGILVKRKEIATLGLMIIIVSAFV